MSLDSENIVDTCYVCNGYGELVICECCERGFHLFCACIESVPSEEFICSDCTSSRVCMHRNWDLPNNESFMLSRKDFENIRNPVVRDDVFRIFTHCEIKHKPSIWLINWLNTKEPNLIRRIVNELYLQVFEKNVSIECVDVCVIKLCNF